MKQHIKDLIDQCLEIVHSSKNQSMEANRINTLE
jgi:hypothetical protein